MLITILSLLAWITLIGGGAYLLFLQGGGLEAVSSEVRHDDEDERA